MPKTYVKVDVDFESFLHNTVTKQYTRLWDVLCALQAFD